MDDDFCLGLSEFGINYGEFAVIRNQAGLNYNIHLDVIKAHLISSAVIARRGM